MTAAMTPARGVTRSLATMPVRAMVAVPIRHSNTSCELMLCTPTTSPAVSSRVKTGGCWAEGISAATGCLARRVIGSTNQRPSILNWACP